MQIFELLQISLIASMTVIAYGLGGSMIFLSF